MQAHLIFLFYDLNYNNLFYNYNYFFKLISNILCLALLSPH